MSIASVWLSPLIVSLLHWTSAIWGKTMQRHTQHILFLPMSCSEEEGGSGVYIKLLYSMVCHSVSVCFLWRSCSCVMNCVKMIVSCCYFYPCCYFYQLKLYTFRPAASCISIYACLLVQIAWNEKHSDILLTLELTAVGTKLKKNILGDFTGN